MNLRSLHLNLLLVFDAIYGERSISRAAAKLHLSQPTVSNALARLRERLQDPLFERSAQGMLPTPRARKLAEPIRQALNTLEHGLRDDEEFDFARSEREFVIAVEDYGESVILPGFIRWLADVAPNLRMRIRAESSAQLAVELREGTVDLALDYFTLPDANYRHACVLTETLLSLSRRDHPLLGERMNLEQYLALRHVMLAAPANARPMIDLAGQARAATPHRDAGAALHLDAADGAGQRHDLHFAAAHGHAVRRPLQAARARRAAAHAAVPGLPDLAPAPGRRCRRAAGHQWFRTHLTEFCQRL